MAKKKSDLKYYEAIGRRKSAVVRVRLYLTTDKQEIAIDGVNLKKGDILVNGRSSSEYFPSAIMQKKFMLPLVLTNNADRFAISIHAAGGGIDGQMDAVILGLARALEKVDKDLRPALKKEGYLTRDARIRERRKVGTGGKARRKKQSPKR